MKISELQEPIKSWALENQRNADESWDKDTNDLWYAFEWHNTTQGHGFWMDVYDGMNLEYLKEEYPSLDWEEKGEKDQPKKLWEWVKLFEEGVELDYYSGSGSLSLRQLESADMWYCLHKNHVNKLYYLADKSFPPTLTEDKNNPALWKAAHWKWYLDNYR